MEDQVRFAFSRRSLITTVIVVAAALIFTISMMVLTAEYYRNIAAEDVLGQEFLVSAREMCHTSAREEVYNLPNASSVHSESFDPEKGRVVVLKFYDAGDPGGYPEEDTLMNPKPRKKKTEYIRCVFGAEPTLDSLKKK